MAQFVRSLNSQLNLDAFTLGQIYQSEMHPIHRPINYQLSTINYKHLTDRVTVGIAV